VLTSFPFADALGPSFSVGANTERAVITTSSCFQEKYSTCCAHFIWCWNHCQKTRSLCGGPTLNLRAPGFHKFDIADRHPLVRHILDKEYYISKVVVKVAAAGAVGAVKAIRVEYSLANDVWFTFDKIVTPVLSTQLFVPFPFWQWAERISLTSDRYGQCL